MYINGKGKIGYSKDSKKYDITILLADIFDTNNCFKAMMMISFDEIIEDGSSRDIEVQISEFLSGCDYFECVNVDFGKKFKIQMNEVYIDADYFSGDIARVFICQDDENNSIVSLISE